MELNELLQRVDLVDLVGKYTALTRAGKEWRGRCPFHNEKSASFYVNAEKGVFKCFGCQEGGGAIEFVKKIENLEFKDAIEWLAEKYNVTLERSKPGVAGGFSSTGEKSRLYELNEAALKFFREQLRSPAGSAARDYIKGRGLSEGTVSDFDLGYAPKEWQALTDHLLGQGARAQELVQLGLIRARDSGGGHFDFFRHRLIFPIRAVTGRVVAFAGRALAAEDNPKYLNVSNTPLYDKSRILYNLERAKGVLKDEGAVIVEGYMDVIGLAQAGVQNAVASCGTALTPEHVALLQRYSDRYYLAFDSDDAGQRAAWGAGKLFLTRGYNPRIVLLSGGKDPDEIAKGEGGRERWLGMLSESEENGVARCWLQYQNRVNPHASSAARRAWVLELAGLYKSLPDEPIRQDLIQDIASALHLDGKEVEAMLRSASAGAGIGESRYRQEAEASLTRPPATHREIKQGAQQRAMLAGGSLIEREIVRRLLNEEKFRFVYRSVALPEWFEDAILRTLYAAASANALDGLLADPQWSALVADLSLAEPLLDDDDDLILRHRNAFVERQTASLQAEYKAAEQRQDEARMRELAAEIMRLRALIRRPRGLGGGNKNS